MRPRLIGLMGYAGSGKSSVAAILETDFQFHRLRFADTLKNMLRTFGLTKAQIDGAEKETPCDLLGGKSPRWAMQTLGTEWGRQLIHNDLWVNAAIATWRKRVEGNYVFDDVRFENEAAAIRREGGEIWRVQRPGYPIVAMGHVSEAGQDNICSDWIVQNTGSLSDLRDKIHNVLEGLC